MELIKFGESNVRSAIKQTEFFEYEPERLLILSDEQAGIESSHGVTIERAYMRICSKDGNESV